MEVAEEEVRKRKRKVFYLEEEGVEYGTKICGGRRKEGRREGEKENE